VGSCPSVSVWNHSTLRWPVAQLLGMVCVGANYLINQPTNSTKQNSYWEADSRLVAQHISHLSCNSKVYYFVQKSPHLHTLFLRFFFFVPSTPKSSKWYCSSRFSDYSLVLFLVSFV
jgi:hypothetical protein